MMDAFPPIRVAGYPYRVQLVPGDHHSLENNLGRIFHEECKIVLSLDQHPEALRETALHETLHAVDEAGSTKLSENQVRILSRLLFGVLRDNPEFSQWLLGKVK